MALDRFDRPGDASLEEQGDLAQAGDGVERPLQDDLGIRGSHGGPVGARDLEPEIGAGGLEILSDGTPFGARGDRPPSRSRQ